MPVDKKVEPTTKPKRASRASSADKSPSRAPRRSTRASSSEKSPPPSRRQSLALSKIPEEAQKKPATPTKSKAKDDVPTVGTPKRRGRPSLNPTPAAVASPVRVTRRSVAAIVAEEVPAVSSPRRKSRAINPSVTASPARVTRSSIAVSEVEEEQLETQKKKLSPIAKIEEGSESRPSSAEKSDHADTDAIESSLPPDDRTPETNIPSSSNRNSPSGSADDETPETKIATHTDKSASSGSGSADDRTPDTKISTDSSRNTPSRSGKADDRTPESKMSTRSNRSTPSGSGSADDKTPETKIPTRSNRSTPSRSGSNSVEFRTPTRSQRHARPSTPSDDNNSRQSPRNVSELKISAKSSPDRHANCSSRESSPIFTTRDLRRNSFPSPIRHSPRSSPLRQHRLSSEISNDPSPKSSRKPTSSSNHAMSVEIKSVSPLASRKSASPSMHENGHTSRSSPDRVNSAKDKESSVPEKHCLEDEDSIMVPNKRMKRDVPDEAGPSSDGKLQQQHSSNKKQLKSEEKNAEHMTYVAEDKQETKSNPSFSFPGIKPLAATKTMSTENVDKGADNLELTTVLDETSVGKQTPSVMDKGSGVPDEEPSPKIHEESVKGVACSKERNQAPNVSHRTETSFASPVDCGEAEEVENKAANEVTPSTDGKRQVLELKESRGDTAETPFASRVDFGQPEEVENKVANEVTPTTDEKFQVLALMGNSGDAALGDDPTPTGKHSADDVDLKDESEEAAGHKLEIDDHLELEQSIILNNSAETGIIQEDENLEQSENVAIVDGSFNDEVSDVTGEKIPTSQESFNLCPDKFESEEGKIAEQCVTVANVIPPANEGFSEVTKAKTPIKESTEVAPIKFKSESERNSGQSGKVVAAESLVINESLDVIKEESPGIKEPVVASPIKSISEVGGNPENNERLLTAESPINEGFPDVTKEKTSTTKETLEISPGESESEESINCEKSFNEELPNVAIEKTVVTKESLNISPVEFESVKDRISEHCETVASAKAPVSEDSSDVPSGKTVAIKESGVSLLGAEAASKLDSLKSAIENIPVDEGYSETSDSEYHSSAIVSSDSGVKVPSIVEGLGIKDLKEDISVINHSSPDRERSRKSFDSSLANIVEVDEEVSEMTFVMEPKDDTTESKQILSPSDKSKVVFDTDGDDKLVPDEQDQPSFGSPLRLAVSPEPPINDEDGHIGSPAIKSPSVDVVKDKESVPVEDEESGKHIDTTSVLGKLGLKKHENIRLTTAKDVHETLHEEKIEEVLVERQEECNPGERIQENNENSVVDRDENTSNVGRPMKGSDFIDDEAEEGEETADESDNDEIIYAETEESDSDVEILDESCFVIDEAKERRLSRILPTENAQENGSDAEDDDTLGEKSDQVSNFDESCFIVENPDEIEHAKVRNTSPELEVPPKVKPVFLVNEILDTGESSVGKTQEFASGAASNFVTELNHTKGSEVPTKSILTSSKVVDIAKPFASTSASQFEVIELDASKGSTLNKDRKTHASKFAHNKKRAATEAEAESLKEKKKYKKELKQQSGMCNATNVPEFRMKLSNIAQRTTIDDLKKGMHQYGIAAGLQKLAFCPSTDQQKKIAIATYDSKEHFERALSGYGNVKIHDRCIFFLLDDETTPASDDKPLSVSPKKSPRKKFVGIISDLPTNVTIGEIINAYEQEGVKCINKVKIFKLKSSNLNFAKLEFSKKTSLLKAIIVTEKIIIKGRKINLKIKEKLSS